ncbi:MULTISPECIES: trypsin-like peptidase domain-containing protein [unclassified Tenacibaculum]|uniref:trypsin-like peptidase domain-containing protein n=1 Tax=unclassified Tenacibaculum TaxID=2635139 RepID=UPI001F1DE635|nr:MULTISPECIES: trypsin-like peptidase domain-containing protein [unclassified Tenacibaculum]MCF2874503.1 trypsin-like peptidase domain-containing protein [Tenacibaculum sp. Cn5-1]MCF2934431.1 trypsin-like peptidase domain-containing protein [Tenacibaculum sp. Cn5-34]MCG7510641.1 trypsin-like peptidase domain-containing protein [Tenacibaculum sp. Cn5-46]
MKNYLFKGVLCALIFLSALVVNAQKAFKIGDEFDSDIKITKTYQKFKKKSSNQQKKELVYSKEFYSKNSSYIKLYFKNFDLAPGDYLEIIGAKSKESMIYGGKGKIVDNSMTTISNFWSKVLFDDKVEVRLYSSGNVGKHNGFEIAKVAYGFTPSKLIKTVEKHQGKSICSSDNKERIACYNGTDMYEKAKAVCRLIINGSSSCTGWLLGSEGHLMTNNHCIGSSSDAQNTDFIFNYQYQSCTGSASATQNVVASSATFVKTSSSLDYTLVKLPTNPTSTYGYLSISPTVSSVGDRIYIPQHPGGRRKEISVNTDTGFSEVSCVGSCGNAGGAGKRMNYYADTEGGSSGSPVIDYNTNFVVAIHNTGFCPNGSYGRSDDLISAIGSSMPANGVGSGGGGNPTGCSSTVNSFPYAQSFETGDGWTQATGDDGNWVRDASGTPSTGTGPSSGADGNYYMFLEASNNSSPGQIGANATAILESPCFNLSGVSSATFTFSNHMYGTNVGSLRLEASTNGTSWTSLWSDSGNKGNQWNNQSVNLSSYVGQNEVRLRFVGTTGSGWSSDIAIDNLALTSGGGSSGCSSLNFNDYTITSFSNQDSSGNYSVGSGGASLTLTNNTWKYISLNYTVTANTVIEFEFSSTSQGEIHGVGFENDNTLTSSRYFKVHGTQNYGITNFDNYASGTKKYVIPVGSSYTGAMDRLVFINDNDGGSGNNSTFSNVKIYEGSCESSNVIVTELFDTRVDILGNEDEGIFTSVNIAPNPIKKGKLLQLVGPERNFSNASYKVVNVLGQVLKEGSLSEEKTINIDKLNSGIYILRLENKFTKTSKRFVIE